MTETNLEHGKGKRDGTGEPVRSGFDDEVLRQNRSDKVRGSFQNDGAISLPEMEPRKFVSGEKANEAIDRSLANPSETNATKIERGVEQKSDLPSVVGSRNEPLTPALSAFQKEPSGDLGNQGGARVSSKPEGVNATPTAAQEGLRQGKQTSNSAGSAVLPYNSDHN